MSQLVKELERELSVIARILREPVVLADGSVVQRSTASLLYLLAEHEPVRMGVVAAALNVDPSTTTRQVQLAIRLGLLVRVEDPVDRRANLISRTAEGREVYEALVDRQRQGLLRLLDGWPDRDQEDLVRLISLFNTRVGQLRAAAATTPEPLDRATQSALAAPRTG